MATSNKGSYTAANANVRREHCAGEVGGAATTAYGKFLAFQKCKLKAVHARVTTAGTATTAKLDVYNGTTSIGTLALSTSTAGSTFSSATLDSAIAALGSAEVRTGADATVKAIVTYEYQVDHDASSTD